MVTSNSQFEDKRQSQVAEVALKEHSGHWRLACQADLLAFRCFLLPMQALIVYRVSSVFHRREGHILLLEIHQQERSCQHPTVSGEADLWIQMKSNRKRRVNKQLHDTLLIKEEEVRGEPGERGK